MKLDKIIYYQASFHHPIDLKDYNKNVAKLNDCLSYDCIKIHNYGGDKYSFKNNNFNGVKVT